MGRRAPLVGLGKAARTPCACLRSHISRNGGMPQNARRNWIDPQHELRVSKARDAPVQDMIKAADQQIKICNVKATLASVLYMSS